jgi:hypothetical protein
MFGHANVMLIYVIEQFVMKVLEKFKDIREKESGDSGGRGGGGIDIHFILASTRKRKAKEKVYIRNETLDRPEISEIGALGALDCISNHLNRPSDELRRYIGRL